MTTSDDLASATRFKRALSAVLLPTPVLSVLIVCALIGSLAGLRAAYALVWSLIALVAAVAALVLAGARPLPRLADSSHLLHRLSWLCRYGVAAVLLCISTFLGGLAGSSSVAGTVEMQFQSLSSLIGTVGAYATQIAVVIFLGWLAVDIWRLERIARVAGFHPHCQLDRRSTCSARDLDAGR